MADIADGETVEVQGSARVPYVLKNVGGVYSCTCPAWRNQSTAIERRTCKHLRKLRGEAAEQQRLGAEMPVAAAKEKDAASAGPGLLLAQSWENDVELAGWWLSEKLDGVRAYWDGKQFLSRQGNTFHAPDWFVEALPAEPLDGELWLARKSFQRTVSIVRRQDKSDHWREIKYLVFDMPAVAAPFEERMAQLRDRLADNPAPHAMVHEQYACRGLEHLREELTRVEALGGEGLMLRQPGSRYETGRSSTLLKVKTFHDAEARVVEHLPGTGRHKGRLGALAVELPDGTAFSVGTGFSDAQRDNPPAVGSTITFRYQELSDRGVPRFPSFVRLRPDAEQGAGTSTAATPEPSSPTAAAKASPATVAQKPATRPASVASRAQPTVPAAGARYFEFVDDKSSKFWEVTVSGVDVTVRYGRIGADGQSKTKTFGDVAAAQDYADKLIEEKTEKGYEEQEQ